jgi:hypothetical protein
MASRMQNDDGDNNMWEQKDEEQDEKSKEISIASIMVRGAASFPSHQQEETAPRSGSDIGSIVSKSKKAASSLWTLLHAKVSGHFFRKP